MPNDSEVNLDESLAGQQNHRHYHHGFCLEFHNDPTGLFSTFLKGVSWLQHLPPLFLLNYNRGSHQQKELPAVS